MASGKEIRTKIASVKSTQKITKAMEMVAASKLRRTQQRMAASRPYADKIKTVIGHLSEANPDYRHPYLESREIKRVGYIVLSTDRGLCGSVNVNTFREMLKELRQWQQKGIEADLCLVGTGLLGASDRPGRVVRDDVHGHGPGRASAPPGRGSNDPRRLLRPRAGVRAPVVDRTPTLTEMGSGVPSTRVVRVSGCTPSN